jgi:hypothetical protein
MELEIKQDHQEKIIFQNKFTTIKLVTLKKLNKEEIFIIKEIEYNELAKLELNILFSMKNSKYIIQLIDYNIVHKTMYFKFDYAHYGSLADLLLNVS